MVYGMQEWYLKRDLSSFAFTSLTIGWHKNFAEPVWLQYSAIYPPFEVCEKCAVHLYDIKSV